MAMRSVTRKFWLFSTLLSLGLVVVVILQNNEPTAISILWWNGEYPKAVVLFVVAVFSALFTFFFTLWNSRW